MRDGVLDEGRSLTKRHALRVVATSAGRLRYQSAPDRNITLRSSILSLAHRYRRYGAGMIELKLRQYGLVVNRKRVERLYSDAELQVCKRKCERGSMGERQPLTHPGAANEVWSMDFVFDRSADTRVIKIITIVDDTTRESVAIVSERAIGAVAVTHILDRLAMTRGLPRIIRTDNGKEFCGRAMLTWPN